MALVLSGTGWLIRLLYYRMSVHNARFYDQLVAYEQQQWWAEHRQPIGLQEGLLLGPMGKTTTDWLRVLSRHQRPPEEENEGGGRALRAPYLSVSEAIAREKRLAELLVMEWQRQRSERTLTPPLRCYWQGTELAWQAFRAQMTLTVAQMTLPSRPHAWRGEASLAEIAHTLAEAAPDDTVLIAGCQVVVAQPGAVKPAGESAVLWLAGRGGPVHLTRGETHCAEKREALTAVAARVLEQNELSGPPEACALFFQPGLEALAHSGWDINLYRQDACWGDIGEMEGLTVLSLAAIYAAHYQQPCGWIARDPLNTLAIGIVKPDGQRQ
ncbi:hypothetical protein BME90_14435 [Klebsiella quasipneumoniae subsp. similipneumoniae]|nr:hypothetical protein BME90_14435 [Klebsiella quasipneumoniae subsp. similipneumoniae]OVV15582.1 hypothetical protein BME89_14570 [Klebsiella quasipneumoniae subsp. similipneumoniae]